MPSEHAKSISRKIRGKCPLCQKQEIDHNNDLVCSNCNNNSLELIRNSCIENDSINDIARSNINKIFASCQNVNDLDKIEMPMELSDLIPHPSINAMKSLALQLIKLDILNTNLKIKNINKTQELLELRIKELNRNIDTIRAKLDTEQERLNLTCSELVTKFEVASHNLNTKIFEYKFERINQIEKQSIQLQYNHYKVLKELIFTSSTSKSRSLSYISKLKANNSSHLLFHGRPILNINEFFNYNYKLPQINEFLENLIRLQVHLQDIFNEDSLRLPYLEELIEYLPNSKFYDMIQEKENFMMNGGKISSDEIIDESEDGKKDPFPNIKADNERVIKLGKTIKLPLSSKTINSQLRRASLNKEEIVTSTKPIEDTKTADKNVSSPIKSSISGKRMIILPHKILTKPFTKLTPKEYLKFLLVIVKILFNFKTLFYFTVDSLPYEKDSSSILSNTIYHSSNLDNKTYHISFEKILEKIASMDKYFDYKLKKTQCVNKTDMSGSRLLASNAGTFTSYNNYHSSSASNATSNPHSPNSNTTSTHSFFNNKSSVNYNTNGPLQEYNGKLRHFYSKHFKDSIHKPNDREIYGNFSESKYKSNLLLYQYEEDNNSLNESELKNIMQSVYKLMATGTSRHQRNLKLNNKSKNLDFNAMNMIAQSKAQLDDWDVVSKMY